MPGGSALGSGIAMLLVVDVDEVETHVGVFPDGTRAAPRHARFATVRESRQEELGSALGNLLGQCHLSLAQIDRSVVCSTVPHLSREWAAVARLHLGHPMLVAGSSLSRAGMPSCNGHDDVGAHRLGNVLAAYDHVRDACVVVDFGAVIAYDAVSASGEYLGGVMMPRAETALHALCGRTSMLSRVELTVPPSPIGRSTVDALRSGAVHGFAGQVEAIIRRLRHELGGRATVIATGAAAPAIVPMIREPIDEVDELLTLNGLRLTVERNSLCA